MALSLTACGGAASTSTAASAASGTAASASAATADSDLAYMQANGKMVIGYTVYEPMNYITLLQLTDVRTPRAQHEGP